MPTVRLVFLAAIWKSCMTPLLSDIRLSGHVDSQIDSKP
jgi:hypothetical protein